MSVTLESWQLGLLVAALAVALAAATALGVVVRRVSWEHPGIIAKSFNPGPDRRVRAAGPGSTLSSAGEPGAAVAVQVQPAKGRATPAAAVDDAAGAAPTTARRKSLVAMPLETPVADWEIDPRKLKMKYVVGKGNFGYVVYRQRLPSAQAESRRWRMLLAACTVRARRLVWVGCGTRATLLR